ncbi:unnamed protein product [Phytomonas sp. Hart1]|nr:unnamed protein product [Phytomonas sp. Hart1]|eukprot:CCW70259.1 unnamed protein product [Phytomonas sp. isolate Hart1]
MSLIEGFEIAKVPKGFLRQQIRLVLVACICTICISTLFYYFTYSSQVVHEIKSLVLAESTSLRTGKGIAEFNRGLQLIVYQNGNQVVVLIALFYLFLQLFCIPGTVILNTALGAIMGTLVGVPFCAFLGTLGALCCYTLSRTIGISLVDFLDLKLMNGKGLQNIRTQVNRHRKDLFIYILFLRLTPILPNWLVNLSLPVVGVPVGVFVAATFLGILPQTYLSVRFGAFVKQNQNSDLKDDNRKIITFWDTLFIATIAVILLLVAKLKKRFF